MAEILEIPHYVGHRQRLRQKFLEKGAAALADYELLELLLFNAKPRGDVKPLAKMLLKKFGSLEAVLKAPAAALTQLDGVGEAVIASLKLAHSLALHVAEAKIMNQPVLKNWQQVLDYCRISMSSEVAEQLRLLFLNNGNKLIGQEVQQQGTNNQTAIYPREVAKRALELGAAAVIMVHNHPSGDATPSAADIDITRQVAAALQAVGIQLHDHLIIAGNVHTSLRALGIFTPQPLTRAAEMLEVEWGV